jgi:hypothetical protein
VPTAPPKGLGLTVFRHTCVFASRIVSNHTIRYDTILYEFANPARSSSQSIAAAGMAALIASLNLHSLGKLPQEVQDVVRAQWPGASEAELSLRWLWAVEQEAGVTHSCVRRCETECLTCGGRSTSPCIRLHHKHAALPAHTCTCRCVASGYGQRRLRRPRLRPRAASPSPSCGQLVPSRLRGPRHGIACLCAPASVTQQGARRARHASLRPTAHGPQPPAAGPPDKQVSSAQKHEIAAHPSPHLRSSPGMAAASEWRRSTTRVSAASELGSSARSGPTPPPAPPGPPPVGAMCSNSGRAPPPPPLSSSASASSASAAALAATTHCASWAR